MRITISQISPQGRHVASALPAIWDRFTGEHAQGCPYHLAAWIEAITSSYSHGTCNLMATCPAAGPGGRDASGAGARSAHAVPVGEELVAGVLPLVHVRHWLFGNSLVSMPFSDAGGVLATDGDVERMLVEHALKAADDRQVPVVELRQYQPLSCVDDHVFTGDVLPSGQREVRAVPGWRVSIAADSNKVRMLLDLPSDPDALMRSFAAKLRSQIRKPLKSGLTVKIGGIELVDDFYDVFAVNMRDLGSPVHSKQFLLRILLNFSGSARIFMVYGQGMPMACSLTLGFNGILSNPWASSLRRYSQFAPNMLLYWAMLEHACQKSYRAFDFGRSTVGEGTYRFKEQWGAKPSPLYWYRFARDNRAAAEMRPDKGRMIQAVELWKRLPVPVTRMLGPMIRRYISL